MFTTADIAAAVLAYLIGSLSFAVIVSPSTGLPIRTATAVATPAPPMYCAVAARRRHCSRSWATR